MFNRGIKPRQILREFRTNKMGRQPRFLYLILAGVLFEAVLLAAAAVLLSFAESPDIHARIPLVIGIVSLISALSLAGLLAGLYAFVLRPLKLLSHEIRIITGVNPGYVLELSGRHFLGDIPDAINELGRSFMKAKREIAEAVSAGSSDLENSKNRLETVLTSLRDGIIVCDERARIMFYNPAAMRVFQDNAALSVGRSLYQLIAAAPIENSLSFLRQRRMRHPEEHGSDNDISFVCSTLIGTIISCNMRLLPDLPGLSWSFQLTCEDVSRQTDARSRREKLLRTAIKEMRVSLTSLGLNIESLELLPDLEAERRAALERTIMNDAQSLTGQFDLLAREIEEMESPRYHVNDIFTEDAVACAARRLEEKGIRLTMTGDALWVKADIHSLLLLLEFLAERIYKLSLAGALEIETLLGDRRVYFNFLWYGPAVPESEIRAWKSCQLEPSSTQSVAEVLESHGSDLWSYPHETPGFAVLRFPMPSSTRQWEPPLPLLPARPVYIDFSSYEDTPETVRMKDLPLNRVPFVVFDTETTGITPLEGDEIVSLAGVKIINRGILVGETFDRLVNPGRKIPETSIRFHGITDDMVKEKPFLEETLRAFHAFVGDAVLVGHNAAFDMSFIRMKEVRAGVRFKGPILDTLSLSLYLHGHAPEHSLDAVARRVGVEVRGRHTALGDSLITAQIFIKFIHLLQERGLTTLGQVMEVLRR
jgi:DNA polymerase III subunit epsilon